MQIFLLKKLIIFLLVIYLQLAFSENSVSHHDYLKKLGQQYPCSPTLENPTSQLCTYNQFMNPRYNFWVEEIKESKKIHRKQWEFCYILESLEKLGLLNKGKKGLGFGVSAKPLPAVLAKHDCLITATDQSENDAILSGWKSVQHNQFAGNLASLFKENICSWPVFQERVCFKTVDMNNIPTYLKDYDFCWSSSALEHLGSLQKGFDFIDNSLKCLKPGGVAIHTTEFNLSSDSMTIETGPSVIYRQDDINQLILLLQKEGHQVFPLNLHPGSTIEDNFIDTPPYNSKYHLNLLIGRFMSTSLGLIIKKREC